jgi:hypothetical protein
MDYPKYSGCIIRGDLGGNNHPYGVFRGVKSGEWRVESNSSLFSKENLDVGNDEVFEVVCFAAEASGIAFD